MSRWKRDDKNKMKYDDPNFNPKVSPKSGSAYTIWPIVHTELMEYGLKSIDAKSVIARQKKGAVLLDVREEPQFNLVHAEGSINVPLFGPVQGDSMFDNMKRLATAAFAMKATARNPLFEAQVKEKIPRNKQVIVMCAQGGTLETIIKRTSGVASQGRVKVKEYADPDRAFGRESRSLKACYEVIQAGYKDVVHVEGGFAQWKFDGFPIEERY
eukprot:CAMPEP_0196588624 /NCGR_PEP_ID=MMETSP1081-20130531/61139_1 /TAXON_ID=36882 /ORGANISM="Pyramimonas amylifera, Strain CCMP720" /LENGTH=212 /DNA_ID=CAMNT_0041911169 /DNA_START=181 /DNA_END=819 /DNA_ORIENTATION=+